MFLDLYLRIHQLPPLLLSELHTRHRNLLCCTHLKAGVSSKLLLLLLLLLLSWCTG
jgi:hypothetical protein